MAFVFPPAAASLNWEFRIVGDEGNVREVVGESTNPLYVTYNDPVPGTALYHTVVHVGCVAASGAGPTEQAVFDAVWGKFQSLNIKKVVMQNGQVVEGDTLTYYGQAASDNAKAGIKRGLLATREGAGHYLFDQNASRARELNVQSTQQILSVTDGTCGAWQDFTIDVFGAQGIHVDKIDVAAKPDPTTNTAYGLKVNPTMTGQGGGVPLENTWSNHAMIAYNGTFYDPSYGISYFGVGDVAKQSFISSLHSIGTISSDQIPIVITMGYGGVYIPEKQPHEIALDDLAFKINNVEF